ncbi:hypothetical protein [Flammeovirga aprica]|uniref:Uncharacterized protein n=1 Tax=Flammeovirga aprica JL-4 TaxID=694437 RepID=A0A7X9XAB4_9BACT|nr:hypothetical protein [Flammeovirga aprica]NME69461.1 hypothetical protein [Flammeovirga aprica JL-4]
MKLRQIIFSFFFMLILISCPLILHFLFSDGYQFLLERESQHIYLTGHIVFATLILIGSISFLACAILSKNSVRGNKALIITIALLIIGGSMYVLSGPVMKIIDQSPNLLEAYEQHRFQDEEQLSIFFIIFFSCVIIFLIYSFKKAKWFFWFNLSLGIIVTVFTGSRLFHFFDSAKKYNNYHNDELLLVNLDTNDEFISAQTHVERNEVRFIFTKKIVGNLYYYNDVFQSIGIKYLLEKEASAGNWGYLGENGDIVEEITVTEEEKN